MNFASFEGAEDIAVAWARGLAPDPAQTVAEWADRHRILSSRAASEAGPYRTSRTPYLKAIMEALSPNNPAQLQSVLETPDNCPTSLKVPLPLFL